MSVLTAAGLGCAQMDIIFGITGSLLTDAIGVRKTAMMALAMASVGRMFFVLGRSSTALWITSLTFSPFGEAVLGTGVCAHSTLSLCPPLLSCPQPSLALGTTLSVSDSVCTMCMCASTLCVAMRSQGFIRWRSRSSRHRGSDPWLSRCNTRRSTSAARCATSRLTTCACGRCENKAPFLRHFHIKTIVLPRQARGKDRETLKRRERVFRRMSC